MGSTTVSRQGIRYEAAGGDWHSFGAYYGNMLGRITDCHETGSGSYGTTYRRVLPIFDGELWSWPHSDMEAQTAFSADFPQSTLVGIAAHRYRWAVR